jgi:hypothetical protein
VIPKQQAPLAALMTREGVKGGPPGSKGWTIPESTDGQAPGRIVRNVVSPEYVPYLPGASRNTGTGVIVAPGGGRPN